MLVSSMLPAARLSAPLCGDTGITPLGSATHKRPRAALQRSNSFFSSAIVSSGLVTLWPTVRGSS